MENREIYASDGSYKICRLVEEDRKEYMNLLNEVNTISNFYENQAVCDIMWKIAIGSSNQEFSIFDRDDNYCGNIMLKYTDPEHPEIGIDIVRKYRNHGIAPKVIKMFARRADEDQKVDYYIIRVSSENSHSRHMIEKLGVVPDDAEDIFYERVVCAFMKVMDGSYESAREKAREILGRDNEEVVYQYRYLPEVFCNEEWCEKSYI